MFQAKVRFKNVQGQRCSLMNSFFTGRVEVSTKSIQQSFSKFSKPAF